MHLAGVHEHEKPGGCLYFGRTPPKFHGIFNYSILLRRKKARRRIFHSETGFFVADLIFYKPYPLWHRIVSVSSDTTLPFRKMARWKFHLDFEWTGWRQYRQMR